MRKRALLAAATTAVACGLVFAALCPGMAVAKYKDSTLDLTSAAVTNATTMTLGKSYSASVTDIYAKDRLDKVRVFKFVPPSSDVYSFNVTETSADMFYVIYDANGALVEPMGGTVDNGVDETDAACAVNLDKGATYYLAVSHTDWYTAWAETVSVRQLKVAKSASVDMVYPFSSNVSGAFKVTFSYTDGTSASVFDCLDANEGGDYIEGLVGRKIADNDGNTLKFSGYADDSDGKKQEAAEAKTAGAYAIECAVESCDCTELAATTACLNVVTDATLEALATVSAMQTRMPFGFHKITANRAGLLFLNGNSRIYAYDAVAKSFKMISLGYFYSEDGVDMTISASAEMAKGQVLYA